MKVEKPRSDFVELVAHHIVTLWMIGWGYGINLTLIGNAIYLTMDWSDVFLAVSFAGWNTSELLAQLALAIQMFQLPTNGED